MPQGHVPFIDITGMQALEEAIVDLHKRGVRVILTGVKPRVESKLRKGGILDLLGDGNVFADFAQALQGLR